MALTPPIPFQMYAVLSVPVKGMEEMVRQIGKCSGSTEDKIDKLGIKLCGVGWRIDNGEDVPAVHDCVAHMLCSIE